MQLPRSEGLGAAFGGGAAENVFGAQTTHVLAKLTVWLGIGFFAVTLMLAIAFAHNQPSTIKFEQEVLSTTTAQDANPKDAVPPTEVATEALTELEAQSLTLQPEAVPTPTPILDPAPVTP